MDSHVPSKYQELRLFERLSGPSTASKLRSRWVREETLQKLLKVMGRHADTVRMAGDDRPPDLNEPVLRTDEVALLFQVSARTVSEWARRGLLPSIRTPGGHRRFQADAIRRALEERNALH